MTEQRPFRFRCHSCWLVGILSLPERPLARGVLIVTGGPQYRVGSHRQFALLARSLAARGMAVLRFDYRGMGDSCGERRSYEHIDDDLGSAVQLFFDTVPELKEVVLWGLCDGATAAAFYAYQDKRICGLILLNPWVRTEAGFARATLRHYYLSRLIDASFWRQLFRGSFVSLTALSSLCRLVMTANATDDTTDTPQRMLDGLSRFHGRILIILSGDDLTAQEFSAMQQSSAKWREFSRGPNVWHEKLAHANHTFSSAHWRDQAAHVCLHWLESW